MSIDRPIRYQHTKEEDYQMVCLEHDSLCSKRILTGDSVVDNYRPRTELGIRLLALRRDYVVNGGQLLDGDALDVEIQMRRGTKHE